MDLPGKEDIKSSYVDLNKTKLELRKYQEFIGSYLDYKSPYHDILLYHGLGSGKSATAINIYNVLYNATSGWNVYLIIKASLHDNPWETDLKKFSIKKGFCLKRTKIFAKKYGGKKYFKRQE